MFLYICEDYNPKSQLELTILETNPGGYMCSYCNNPRYSTDPSHNICTSRGSGHGSTLISYLTTLVLPQND